MPERPGWIPQSSWRQKRNRGRDEEGGEGGEGNRGRDKEEVDGERKEEGVEEGERNRG